MSPSAARRALVASSTLLALATARPPAAAAQDSLPATRTVDEARRIAGRVVRPGDDSVTPVRGLLVTLHRVGPEGGRPLDSMRTGAGGRYDFRYRATGSDEAVYFVSALYGGIAYFSTPTRAATVPAGEGDITVFDTTSSPAVRIGVGGRHLVIAAPTADGRREVAEIFDLRNDTSVTRIGSERTQPTFRVHLPEGAIGARVSAGDIAPAAVTIAPDGDVRVYAPVSPGIRQLALMYALPPSAFPLSVPLGEETAVLEVLTEEPEAEVTGARLTRRESATTQGRTFQRWLAQDAPAGAVVHVAFRETASARRSRWVTIIAAVIGAILLFALAWAFRRRPAADVGRVAAPDAGSPDALLRAIADLDAAFEREPAPSEERRAAYAAERAALKARLAAALAGAPGDR